MKTLPLEAILKAAKDRISAASPYKLRVVPSGIHRLGVRAGRTIPACCRVIEYAGEQIGRAEARRRFLHGSPGRSRRTNYLAQLDPYWTVDGAVNGNGAELINHACDPNLALRKFRGRLWLYSLRHIRKGEELAYDYGFAAKGERVRCQCGSPNCRGTINRKT